MADGVADSSYCTSPAATIWSALGLRSPWATQDGSPHPTYEEPVGRDINDVAQPSRYAADTRSAGVP